jgi:hypothetical protein
MNGGEYMAVCSTGQLEDCAILRRSQKGGWSCTTCERNKLQCQHMKNGDGTSRLPRTTRDDLDARLDKFLDPDGKARRLTCLSRQPVPQVIKDSEHAVQFTSAFPPRAC